MARIRDFKNEAKTTELLKAKKGYLRKVTFMKTLELVKVAAIAAIALKYLGVI